ncbi:unnamed protein product [Gordionus sp. m RMFG-2023]|uniref:eukaryotic translation initiation factor 3 subunit H-like n=1 Tax=Gordionus sp. m RMFG-2023 TaxID=3053472 RepID=UPI0030E46498
MTSEDFTSISLVEVDFIVLLKIIKHCEQEIAGLGDNIQGFLMGLKVKDRLEVTNCSPNPKNTESSEEINNYQMDLMKNLIKLRFDTLQIGWYQNTPLGNFINAAFIENQFNYQAQVGESIVLIYDNLKTSRGFLALRAYRLTPKGLQICSECGGDYSPEKIQKFKINYDSLFQEIPVYIKTSNLTNVLLSQLETNFKLEDKFPSKRMLDLDFIPVLDYNLRTMMLNLDDINQENNKLNMYYRQNAKQLNQKQQYIAKREIENKSRELSGLPPLPDEDIDKLFKPFQPPQRLDSIMISDQLVESINNINRYLTQGMAKLLVTDALKEKSQ